VRSVDTKHNVVNDMDLNAGTKVTFFKRRIGATGDASTVVVLELGGWSRTVSCNWGPSALCLRTANEQPGVVCETAREPEAEAEKPTPIGDPNYLIRVMPAKGVRPADAPLFERRELLRGAGARCGRSVAP